MMNICLLMCSQQDPYNTESEDDDNHHVEEECDSLSAAITYQYQKMAETSNTGECSYDSAAETRRKRYQKDSYFSDEEELDD